MSYCQECGAIVLDGPRPALADIIAAVAGVKSIRPETITGERGNRETSYARHLAIYLAHNDGGLSITALARRLKLNHSTIIGGINRIEHELVMRPETRQDVEAARAIYAPASEASA